MDFSILLDTFVAKSRCETDETTYQTGPTHGPTTATDHGRAGPTPQRPVQRIHPAIRPSGSGADAAIQDSGQHHPGTGIAGERSRTQHAGTQKQQPLRHQVRQRMAGTQRAARRRCPQRMFPCLPHAGRVVHRPLALPAAGGTLRLPFRPEDNRLPRLGTRPEEGGLCYRPLVCQPPDIHHRGVRTL